MFENQEKESIELTQTDPNTPPADSRQNDREEIYLVGEQLAATVKRLLHEGNVRRIIVKHEDQTVLEIPLTVGVVGVIIAPVLAAVGALGALITNCTIEVVRTRPESPEL